MQSTMAAMYGRILRRKEAQKALAIGFRMLEVVSTQMTNSVSRIAVAISRLLNNLEPLVRVGQQRALFVRLASILA